MASAQFVARNVFDIPVIDLADEKVNGN